MPFDGVVATALVQELAGLLVGARVDRIGQPSASQVVLDLRTPGVTHHLAIEIAAEQPALFLLERAPLNPARPPAFVSVLRKHLLGGRLSRLSIQDYERVLRLDFEVCNELGDVTTKTLVCELMGRHSNVILLNRDGIIHDALRHVDRRINRVRETLPAHPYLAPPAQERLLPHTLIEQVEGGKSPFARVTPGLTATRVVTGLVAGFSPFLAAAVVRQAEIPAHTLMGELTPMEKEALALTLAATCRQIVAGAFQPTLYYDDAAADRPLDYHALPITGYAVSRPTPSLARAIGQVEEERGRRRAFQARHRQAERRLRQLIRAEAKKVQRHQSDLASGQKAQHWQEAGELIYANLFRLQGGETLLVATPFDGGPAREIELDVRLSPARNAERYYARYRKAKRRLEMASQLLAADEQRLRALEELLVQARHAQDDSDLEAIREELTDRRVLPTKKTEERRNQQPGRPASRRRKTLARRRPETKAAKTRVKDEVSSPRHFRSTDGFLIRVGRSNLQNDRLTFRQSAADDVWLHVKNAPGAHVVVQCQGQELPAETLLQAAGLAAWYAGSNRAGGGSVDVDYCPVRQVKKIPGARPGQVLYDRFQTIRVSPLNPASLPAEPPALDGSGD